MGRAKHIVNYIIKVRRDHFEYYCVLSIIILYITFYLAHVTVPVPLDSHYFVSNLDTEFNEDSMVALYALLKTPIYIPLGWAFSSPSAYFLLSVFCTLIIAVLTYKIYLNSTGDHIVAYVFTILSGPIFMKLAHKLIPLFLDNISIVYPSIWGFMTHFTVRAITGIGYLSIIYIFVKHDIDRKRLNIIYGIIFLSFMAHPNSGLTLSASVAIILLLLISQKNLRLKELLWFFVAFLVGMVPSLVKIIEISEFRVPSEGAAWVGNLFYDEADDYSVIYWIVNAPAMIFTYTMAVILAIWWSINYTNIKKIIIWSAIVPLTVFYAIGILEWVALNFKIYLIFDILATSQIGHKMLPLSFIPLMIILVKYFSNLISKTNLSDPRLLKGLFVMSCIVFVFTCSLKSQNVKHKITVISKIQNHKYIDIINGATARTAERTENPAFIPIYRIKKNLNIKPRNFNEMSYLDKYRLDKYISSQLQIDEFYYDKFNNIDAIRSLVDIIEKHVVKGDGIIIPPYFEMMRDLLRNYKIFFTDKHDGNLILGGRIPAGIVLERRKMLYSVDYRGMFHLSSGLQSSSLRNGYRDLTEDTIRKINEKHPAYRHFLTENDIKLDLELVSSNDYWTLYKL